MHRMLLVLVVGVGLVFTQGSLTASTFLSAEFREIVSDAVTVVRGHVTDVRTVRSAAGDVESVVTIAVDSVLKGSADPFISMRVPGGVTGRYRTVMIGAPVMRVGDQGVFFLRRASGNTFWPVGLAQGIYRVTVSSRGTAMVAAPVLTGVTTNATGAVVRGDPRRKALPVSEFESLVRLVVAGGAR
jgi:hypothetical protein